ncbi:hypothetical protein EHS25_004887 [Saitozyma podzolica]|uniref:Uncharacterized protein n=1 Tax=Saitozyma podzolica TaxID=1890683 RepID=A0A427Y345_9TREE|nr:hypothetical protein EHS25_004887 [Saitozyma podzolica]
MADDSDSEGDAQTGTENEGGPNIISHQGAVFMMDTARRFVQTQPLVDAAVRGDIPGLQSLLQQPGINVNVRNGLEETALFAAVCHDHLEAARLLLDAGADPDLKCFNEWAALHATVSPSGAAVPELGADPTSADSNGYTTLHHAVIAGLDRALTVTPLLRRGVDPDLAAGGGWTPLLRAIQQMDLPGGHREAHPRDAAIECRSRRAVELLLANGADHGLATERDGLLLSRIFQAVVRSPEAQEIVRLLVGAGALATETMQSGISLAHTAALQGNPEMLRVLAQGGADINAVGVGGGTPLHVAARFGHPECISDLLELGATASPRDRDRSTPLHEAARRADEESIRLLVDAGADMTITIGAVGQQSPLDMMWDKARAAQDPEAMERYLGIVAMMMEKLAQRDPQARQVVQDLREGWFMHACKDLGAAELGEGLGDERQRRPVFDSDGVEAALIHEPPKGAVGFCGAGEVRALRRGAPKDEALGAHVNNPCAL